MNILIGDKSLNVNSAYAYRYPDGKLVLFISIPQDEIDFYELRSLIHNNTADIVYTKEDGTSEIFSGFRYTLKIEAFTETTYVDDLEIKQDIFKCEVECISETERKLGDLKNTVNEQEFTIEELKQITREQKVLIDDQNALLEEQSGAITGILTEVVPSIIEEIMAIIMPEEGDADVE